MEFEHTVQAKLFCSVYKKSYFSAVQAYLAPEIQTAKKKKKKKKGTHVRTWVKSRRVLRHSVIFQHMHQCGFSRVVQS